MRRAARERPGLQAEVVLSLGLVMAGATCILGVTLIGDNEARLRELLGRALLVEARQLPPPETAFVPGTRWWRIAGGAGEGDLGVGPAGEPIDAETRSLALESRERREPLLRPGAPWQAIRFAAPVGGGGAVAARLPSAASLRLRALPLALAAGLLAVDVAVFTAFGVSMLRRRAVQPLQRLAGAARVLADGAFEARLPVDGPREVAEVAAAFNDMAEALARRTAALEKAVADLRDTNAALRRARAGLDRAERLASVGRLAAGVAHEVGNPMGALLAFLDLAQRDAGIAAATREHLARALQQGERVRRILRQLLEFSRPPRMARVPLDLAALAEEAATLVRAQARYAGICVEVEREGEAGLALGDAGAIAQILLNLVLNACDAVRAGADPGTPATAGGRVRLLVRGAPLHVRAGGPRSEAGARHRFDAVECVVADDGCGIAEGDRERLFDPFFTTKAPGEGTGLGLSNSLRLAEELGGGLECVEPPAGWRTAFALRLPAAEPNADTAGGCEVRSEVRGAEAGGASGGAEKREL